MDARTRIPQDEPISDLVMRLVEEGKTYARAEVDLYKEIARYRAAKARNGTIALIAGGVLLWFAFTALVLGAVFGLATLIGPLAAGLIVAAALGAGGFVLVQYGLKRVRALSGDEEEREALERGEKVT